MTRIFLDLSPPKRLSLPRLSLTLLDPTLGSQAAVIPQLEVVVIIVEGYEDCGAGVRPQGRVAHLVGVQLHVLQFQIVPRSCPYCEQRSFHWQHEQHEWCYTQHESKNSRLRGSNVKLRNWAGACNLLRPRKEHGNGTSLASPVSFSYFVQKIFMMLAWKVISGLHASINKNFCHSKHKQVTELQRLRRKHNAKDPLS